MTVSIPGFSVRSFSRRAFVAACVALSTAFGLSGCAVFSSVTPLPSLSAAQEHRDALVRTEQAVAWRSKEIAAKATQCGECAKVVDSIAAAAQQRVESLGGVWQPWPADLPQSAQVEFPLAVAEAPTQPVDFAVWLAAGARKDLADLPSLSLAEDHKPAWVASALARLLSAHRLAAVYEAPLPPFVGDVAVDLPLVEASGADGNADTPPFGEEAVDPERDVHQSALNDARVEKIPVLVDSVRSWDCAAQLLPGLGVNDDVLSLTNEQTNILLTRASVLLTRGVEDARVLRCQTEGATLASVAQSIIHADAAAIVADDGALLQWSISVADADISSWQQYVTESDLFALIQATVTE